MLSGYSQGLQISLLDMTAEYVLDSEVCLFQLIFQKLFQKLELVLIVDDVTLFTSFANIDSNNVCSQPL